jgi:signal peptidase I
MPRLSTLLYAVAGVLVVLFAGKLLELPVALMVVSGSSIEPSLKAYDLVLGVKPGLAGDVKKGDIVVWCLGNARWRSSCIIHRVVELHNVSGTVYVVAKGDALDRPDLPIPLSRVDYVVVLRIPRLYVLAVFLAVGGAGAAYYYVYLPAAVHGLRRPLTPGAAALAMVFAFAIFNLAYVGVAALDPAPILVKTPGVHNETLVFNLSSGLVHIHLSYDSILEPVSAPECRIVRPFEAQVELAEYSTTAGNASIVLHVPQSVFLELYQRASSRAANASLPSPPAKLAAYLWLRCELHFDKGVLRSMYPLEFSWIEPMVNLTGDGRVAITNRNPIPINVTLEVYSSLRHRIILRENLTLSPFTTTTVEVPKPSRGDTLYVRVYYTFLGHRRAAGVAVHG